MAAPTCRTLLAAVALAIGLLHLSPPAAADPVAPGSGRWPLIPAPDVVRGFEPPSSQWGAGHRGVDLPGRAGQPVHAAAPGRVSFAGTIAGRGVVVVDHGGTRTTYEPVRSAVHVGDRVGVRAVIGRLQLVGSHCFPAACLHWGLLAGERYLDPLTLVGAAPVRLLPLHGSSAAPTPARTAAPRPAALRRTGAPGPRPPARPPGASLGTAALFRAGPGPAA
jgi:murein DD-endopeptidase MepM/ murein hydrolase activator NlpD